MSDEKKQDQDQQPKKGQVRLQIKAGDDVAKGAYSNVVFIHNNDAEFVLDFVFMEPQRPQGQVVSRVVTNPRTVKKLHMGLTELLRRFEERHGEIEIPKSPSPQGTYH